MSISELGVKDSVFLNTCELIPLGEDHGADDFNLFLAVHKDVDLHAPLPLT